MSAHKIIYAAVGVVLGFAVGFVFADRANRGEHDKLRAEVARLRAAAPTPAEQPAARTTSPDEFTLPDLTDEQLRNAVARADANPGDLALQRTAGQALHLYAVQKGNASVLPDAARILKRVHDSDPRDIDVLLRLANALYVLARNGDAGRMREARALLEKASSMKPRDAEVLASLGLTYFHDRPSDPRRAAQEYRRALEADPRNEMALENLAAAMIASGDFAEAERRMAELEKVNASNETLVNLRAQLAQKKNAAGEKN